ncbi:MAG: hypothetical protein ACRENC_07785 [Gemmatimonadaceae bacterium]
MPHRDLSLDEQEHVRVCLRALHARFKNWRNVERSLPVAHSVLVDLMSGRCEISVVIAFRAAKVLQVSIYDVIAGRAVPAGTCAHCGKEPAEHWRCAGEAG